MITFSDKPRFRATKAQLQFTYLVVTHVHHSQVGVFGNGFRQCRHACITNLVAVQDQDFHSWVCGESLPMNIRSSKRICDVAASECGSKLPIATNLRQADHPFI